MNKNEKLKLVFDFIADYLIEENKEEVVKTKNEVTTSDNLAHAHELMKKIDVIDKTNNAVKTATKPLMEEISKLKKQYKEETLSDKFVERTGVTLDDDGKLVKINVGPITEEKSIEQILTEQGVLSNNK